MLRISYSTVKQWIFDGKLKTVKTPGGHHRLALGDLEPFLELDGTRQKSGALGPHPRSGGGNQIPGTVVSVRIEGLMAEVVLAIGDVNITAIITADAVRALKLKKGDKAAALVKSTNVMIERLDNESD